MADALANLETLKKMKVADLKKELAVLGLSTKGLKPELLQRLEQHLREQAEAEELIGESGNDALNGDGEGDGDVEEADGMQEGMSGADPLASDEKVADKSKSLSAETSVSGAIEERRLARAKRFGVEISPTDKKTARAIRFGVGSPSVTGTSTSDKLKQREKRFGIQQSGGTQSGTQSGTQVNPDDRIKKRQERFGIVVASSPKSNTSKYKLDNRDKLKRRQEKFSSDVGTPELEAKKKKRAERFGNV